MVIPTSSAEVPVSCPKCGGSNLLTLKQRNNFAVVELQGLIGVGTDHLSTTRTTQCADCQHVWETTTSYHDTAGPDKPH